MDQIQHCLNGGRFTGTVSSDKTCYLPTFETEGYIRQLEGRVSFHKMLHFRNHHKNLQMFDFCDYCNLRLRMIPPTDHYRFLCFLLCLVAEQNGSDGHKTLCE